MFRHFWLQIAVVQEGKLLLTLCNLCGMHMIEGRIIKHIRTVKYDRNTQMRSRRRNVEIAAKCTGATFSITGEDGEDFFKGVDSPKYLGRILHRADKD